MRHWTWWFGMSLGTLLIAAGTAETVRLLRTGDGGLWFWFPTLVGGGGFIIAGTLVLSRRPGLGRVLTCSGCALGILPTMWTLIVPVLLIVLAVVSVQQSAATVET